MIASRILMKKEINVHAVNTSNMVKMMTELKTSQGTMSPLLSMMVLQVTMRDRMILVADNTERTIKMTLWLSSTRSKADQTARVTYKTNWGKWGSQIRNTNCMYFKFKEGKTSYLSFIVVIHRFCFSIINWLNSFDSGKRFKSWQTTKIGSL